MIKNLTISACVIVLITILLEGSLRLFLPIHLVGYDEVYVYDEKIGAVFKPNTHYLKTTDYLQEARTNKFGTINFQESFDQYKNFIFTIGDSYTQGTGLPGDASYPFQLDFLLNVNGDEYTNEYAIINLGREATGGIQSILYLEKFKHIAPRTDYILYFACEDDVLDDTKYEKGIKHKNVIDNSPHWGIWTKPLKILKNDTEIGKRLYVLVNHVIKKSLSSNLEQQNISQSRRSEDSLPIPEAQLDIFLKLNKLSKGMNAKLIISWTEYTPPNSRYRWLKNWAEENEIEFADWHKKVEIIKKAIPDLPVHNPHSGVHYRSWVNSLIAQSFAESVALNEHTTNGFSGREEARSAEADTLRARH